MSFISRWILLISAVLAFAGCSQGESRVEEGNRLGVLHIGNGAEPQSLDPQVATDVSSGQIMWAIHEGLVTLNPETLEPEPGIADSWHVSEDGTTYTFKIRSDGRWSNGDPITVDDVHWSFKRYLTPALGNPWSYMLFPVVNAEPYASGKIDDFSQVGFEVVDENTFQIQLRNPTPYFLQLIAHSSSSIVPGKVIESFGSPTARYSQWTRAGNLVGAGPFVLETWDISQPIVVKRNPHYWGSDQIELNEIWFHPIENGATEERLFRAGQLHITGSIPTDKIPVYEDSGSPAFHSQAYLGTYYYKINTTRPPFDDVRVRLALAMTIDREAITERVLQRTGSPAYAFVPPGTLGYE
ncbi:MAG: peptide ABC transporter substrate-binding protein, partial [Pseudomonadales bacterium]